MADVQGTAGNDTLVGAPGAQHIDGLGGADLIRGDGPDSGAQDGDGDDTIDGGTGNDTIGGQGGDDHIDGGADDDRLFGSVGDDTVLGGTGDDFVRGNQDDDSVLGGDGEDTVEGNDGTDTVDGGAGDDEVFGGAGNDSVRGGTGNDLIRGDGPDSGAQDGDGDDTIDGGDGNDTIGGQGGDDHIDGGADDDRLFGSVGDDTVMGGTGDDFVRGNQDDDSVLGGDGEDTVDGGAGDDEVFGGAGNDIVRGGTGNDLIRGDGPDSGAQPGDGDDTIDGGGGNDTIGGQGGDDHIDGGADDDRLFGSVGDDTLEGGEGDDFLSGGTGDDRLDGGAGDDTVKGDGGVDTLIGSLGNDSLTGEDDGFIVDYSAFGDTITLQTAGLVQKGEVSGLGPAFSGSAGTDTIGGFDQDPVDFVSARKVIGADGLANAIDGTSRSGAVNVVVDLATGRFDSTVVRVVDNFPQFLLGVSFGFDIENFANVVGTINDDTVIGDDGDNIVTGSLGSDRLVGNGGHDTLDYNNDGDDLDFAVSINAGGLYQKFDGDGNFVGADIVGDFDMTGVTDFFEKVIGDGDFDGDSDAPIRNFLNGSNVVGGMAQAANVVIDLSAGTITANLLDGDGEVVAPLVSFEVENFPDAQGGTNDDTIIGDGFDNRFFATGGNDSYDGDGTSGGGDDDSIDYDDTDGLDVAITLARGEILKSDGTVDTISGIETIIANGDRVSENTVNVEPGDQIVGAGARASIDLGANTFQLKTVDGALTIIERTAVNFGNANGTTFDDTIAGSETANVLKGFGGEDALAGGAGDDSLVGGGGDDAIEGGAGDDVLKGQDGDDTLTGGDGGDTFFFDDRDFNNNGGAVPVDTVTDFEIGVDTLSFRFDGGFFAGSTIATGNGNTALVSSEADLLALLDVVKDRDGTVSEEGGDARLDVVNPANDRELAFVLEDLGTLVGAHDPMA